ncbi:MAG: hypothetical protein JWM16_2987 [Verrucomicrobiales bacterium]|nr:hypothetical protein [Verrucomicrobiales bacterium]
MLSMTLSPCYPYQPRRSVSPHQSCDAPCCLRPKSEGSAFGLQYSRGHTGSLALRPGNSLTILLDGFVNRPQDFQFPSFLLFKLRGFDFYLDGTFTHCSCQPSLDAHFPVPIPSLFQKGLNIDR